MSTARCKRLPLRSRQSTAWRSARGARSTASSSSRRLRAGPRPTRRWPPAPQRTDTDFGVTCGAQHRKNGVAATRRHVFKRLAMTLQEKVEHPEPSPGISAFGPSRVDHRELPWLHFNQSVLEKAENDRHPLLERLHF